ncbi:MAG: hypothetical protein H0T42_26870 [Deltaproteobacteria bacterium]|nr:hypothetical protein [Deltaproteobacteria bacterium]
MPEYEVPPSKDSQNCYFVRVPDIADGGDVWIDRIETAINPGSHHMNVFRVKTIKNLRPEDGTPVMLGDYEGTVIEGGDDFDHNPCWVSPNWSDWPLVANSQKSDVDDTKTNWQLPGAVAIRLTPGEMLMVQTHYANHTDQPAEFGARVGINFHSYKRSPPPVEMGTLFATKQSIRVCQSRPTPTYSGTCRFPNAATITAANGHFHQRGERFAIYPWDGASIDHPPESSMFYESLSWDEPPMAINLAVPAPINTGIWWDCDYRWSPPTVETCADVNAKDPLQENDCCYTFGGNTDVGEHCNVFLYYYPKVESDVFCL